MEYLDLAAALGGVFFGLFWLFRLGFLANFLSQAVLVGFVGGLAAEILVDQIAKMLGLDLDAHEFFAECWELITHLPDTHLWSALVALLALALLLWGTGLLTDIPSPALGAIVGFAVVPILGGRQLVRLWRARRSEFAVAVACYLGVLLLGPIRGVLVAFLLSVIDVVRRAADPSVDILGRAAGRARYVATTSTPDADLPDGVVVLRFSAPVFSPTPPPSRNVPPRPWHRPRVPPPEFSSLMPRASPTSTSPGRRRSTRCSTAATSWG